MVTSYLLLFVVIYSNGRITETSRLVGWMSRRVKP